MTQRDLFHDDAGRDLGRPLPDEDIEATGFTAAPAELSAGIEKLNALTKDKARELDRQMSKSGTQGKCLTCKECFRWHSRRPLRLAYCPQCGTKLVGTTHQNRWPWTIGVEPLTAVQAWAKFKNTK